MFNVTWGEASEKCPELKESYACHSNYFINTCGIVHRPLIGASQELTGLSEKPWAVAG